MSKFKSLLIITSAFLFAGCALTINVEYPVFPNTKEGRQLKSFINNRRNVAMIVETPDQSTWSSIFNDSSFIDQIPAKIFDKFNREGYYKLIDTSKTPNLMNEIANSLTGLTRKRLELGKQLQAEMFLYIGYNQPVTTCGSTMKEIKEYYTNKKGEQESRKKMVPTGYRAMLIPLNATLIVTETGGTMKAVTTQSYKKESDPGIAGCPDPLTVFYEALDIASQEVLSRLSPKVKTEKITIIKKDKDPEVEAILKEAYEEMKGETPSLERAFLLWKKADQKAGGKSEGVIQNIGAYYFAIGDFENAIKYFDKGMNLNGKKKKKFRNLRKRVEAVKVTDDRND